MSLVLVGGGGHCRSCIEVIETVVGLEIQGIIDIPQKIGTEISGYRVLGSDEDIPSFVKKRDVSFLITCGQIKSPQLRIKLFDLIRSVKGKLPVISSISSRVSRRSKICDGTIVMHNAIINAGVQIGNNVIINTGAIIEHDAVIGDHSHISTSAVVNGDARVGIGCFIGSGVVVSNGVTICNECLIGAGTVVIRDISVSGTYVGNPARRIE